MKARVRRLLPRWPWARVLLAAPVVVVLFAGVMASATHVADSLTVTVWARQEGCGHGGPCSPSAPGELAFTKTFTDGAIIGAVQDIVNGVTRYDPLYLATHNGLCNNLPGDVMYDYELRFQWRGMTTQVATTNSWCPEWDIRTLGIPDPLVRFDMSRAALGRIAWWTKMPVAPY
jgi:hypothetical protein